MHAAILVLVRDGATALQEEAPALGILVPEEDRVLVWRQGFWSEEETQLLRCEPAPTELLLQGIEVCGCRGYEVPTDFWGKSISKPVVLWVEGCWQGYSSDRSAFDALHQESMEAVRTGEQVSFSAPIWTFETDVRRYPVGEHALEQE